MNLFLSTISSQNTPFGIFFSDDLAEISEVYFERNDFFLDRLSTFPELEKVQKIFYVSGPASFTSLRNMSVFLSVFTEFSESEISLHSISTGEFFDITFPYSDLHILSVGRRESFVFLKNPENSEMPYKKYKNPEVIEIIKNMFLKNPEMSLSGEFSEKFLELKNNEIADVAFSFPIPQKEFLQNILENSGKFLISQKRAPIDYGALPNIG